MICNIFIFNNSGSTLYHRNISGAALDLQLVQGFSSSLSTFTTYLVKAQLKTNSRGGGVARTPLDNEVRCTYFRTGVDMFIYMRCGDCNLVSHSPASAGKELIERQLLELHSALTFLFGPHTEWGSDILFEGIDDIVDYIFHKHVSLYVCKITSWKSI